MKVLIKQRVKKLLFYIFLISIASILLGNKYVVFRTELLEDIDAKEQEILALESKIVFGNFSTQDVDSYIVNLHKQIDVLQKKEDVYDIKLGNALWLSEVDSIAVLIEKEENAVELNRYYLDNLYMSLAGLDWHAFRSFPPLVDVYNRALQLYTQVTFSLDQANNSHTDGYYVKQGDVIGTQGCSGVCTGTHIHFKVVKDNQVQDPCDLLPIRQLSRWGVADECGVEDPEIIWPLTNPWIVTQNFGDISPVTGDWHDALDLIDGDYKPVLAVHDGWYFRVEMDCRGAYICNGGYANIAVVCEAKDCNSGLKTEYWHLDWLVR